MTARLLALDLVAVLVVATLWVAVAAVLRTGRSRLALGLLAAAVLATAARVVLVAVLARSGWWFVQEKVLLTVPLVVVPGVAAAVLAARALLGGRRPGRFAVASAAAAAGGAATGVLGTFVVGYPVSTAAAVLLPLLVVAAAVVVLGPRVRVVGSGLVGLVLAGVVGGAWWGSRVPDRVEHTGHTGHAHHAVSVADLRGPPASPRGGSRSPRARPTSRCPAAAPCTPGRSTGRSPVPQLTVTQGDLVEVLLRNADIADGVTIHWHGYPVPAGEDGVAGVTQDAVPPGGSFIYRFRATEPGTYWYHAHRRSLEAVRRGLYGALMVRPPTPGPAAPAPRRDRASTPAATPPGVDVVVPLHTMDGTLLTAAPVPDVAPRVPVRLRLINTDDRPHALVLHGTPYRLAAVDGRELAGWRPARRGHRAPAARGRPPRPGVHPAAGPGAPRRRRARHRRAARPRRRPPTARARRPPARRDALRPARSAALGAGAAVRRGHHARARPHARLRRRPARGDLPDQRRRLPGGAGHRGAAGRSGAHDHRQPGERAAPDAPARPRRARAGPRR